MSWWLWLVLAGIVLLAVLGITAVAAARRRRRRTAVLRERFGPEYERALESEGGRREAEADLEDRLERRQGLEVSSLGSRRAAAYDAEWQEIERQFENAQLPAIARADALVLTVLAERGYPTQSFKQRAADLSVDYPAAVEHYRRAHEAFLKADERGATSADLYEALQHYRAFLDDIAAPESSQESEGAQAGLAAGSSDDADIVETGGA